MPQFDENCDCEGLYICPNCYKESIAEYKQKLKKEIKGCGDKMKQKILKLFERVQRQGFKELVEEMDKLGYFDCPSSTKYHGNYAGGLADHCYNVYVLFKDSIDKFKLDLSEESIIIISFLHDLCKVNGYIICKDSIIHNPLHTRGHSERSLGIIKHYMVLTMEEENCIRFHMGFYGSYSFSVTNGEYTLTQLTEAYNIYKIAKLFYFCDDTSSQFVEYKK